MEKTAETHLQLRTRAQSANPPEDPNPKVLPRPKSLGKIIERIKNHSIPKANIHLQEYLNSLPTDLSRFSQVVLYAIKKDAWELIPSINFLRELGSAKIVPLNIYQTYLAFSEEVTNNTMLEEGLYPLAASKEFLASVGEAKLWQSDEAPIEAVRLSVINYLASSLKGFKPSSGKKEHKGKKLLLQKAPSLDEEAIRKKIPTLVERTTVLLQSPVDLPGYVAAKQTQILQMLPLQTQLIQDTLKGLYQALEAAGNQPNEANALMQGIKGVQSPSDWNTCVQTATIPQQRQVSLGCFFSQWNPSRFEEHVRSAIVDHVSACLAQGEQYKQYCPAVTIAWPIDVQQSIEKLDSLSLEEVARTFYSFTNSDYKPLNAASFSCNGESIDSTAEKTSSKGMKDLARLIARHWWKNGDGKSEEKILDNMWDNRDRTAKGLSGKPLAIFRILGSFSFNFQSPRLVGFREATENLHEGPITTEDKKEEGLSLPSAYQVVVDSQAKTCSGSVEKQRAVYRANPHQEIASYTLCWTNHFDASGVPTSANIQIKDFNWGETITPEEWKTIYWTLQGLESKFPL